MRIVVGIPMLHSSYLPEWIHIRCYYSLFTTCTHGSRHMTPVERNVKSINITCNNQRENSDADLLNYNLGCKGNQYNAGWDNDTNRC